MIDWAQACFLAVLQGLTEFLPISSSAHLALTPVILGVEDQGLAFDISVHLGSLAAVIIYFRRELGRVTADTAARYLMRREATPSSRLPPSPPRFSDRSCCFCRSQAARLWARTSIYFVPKKATTGSRRTPVSSRTSRLTASSRLSPGSTNPAMVE